MDAASMSKAMSAMARENDPLKRAAMFTALLEQLAPANAKAAFAACHDCQSGQRHGHGLGNEMHLLLNAWGRLDGKTAIAELASMAKAQGDNFRGVTTDAFHIFAVLSGWAIEDADAAIAYVRSMDRNVELFTAGIVQGLMTKGLDDAVAFIGTLPESQSKMRAHYMVGVADEMLEQGTRAAAAWAVTLENASLREGAMSRVAMTYARENLDAAVAWVSDHADQPYAKKALAEVAKAWAAKDPQAVIDWATVLPEANQSAVFEEAFDQWTEQDPTGASEYLATMSDSAMKDSALQGFAQKFARKDPAAAASWAEIIQSDQLRMETLTRIADDWLRHDRASAKAWLSRDSGLPLETQQSILEASERNPWERSQGPPRDR